MILDSTCPFDLVAEDPNAFERASNSWNAARSSGCRSVLGVATTRSETIEAELRNRVLGYPRIDVDEEISRAAGSLLIRADDAAGGASSVGVSDAYISAMAEVLDDSVLTEHTDDFETLGVFVEGY